MHETRAKQHLGRAGKRVKTGCKTCKIRRVKCDENRPACRRCVSTGRVCDGYGIWGGGTPHANRALSIYCTPVPVVTREEQGSFDWFMEKARRKFTSLYSSDFWETLVFQASAQEPCVRHAVIALSAAHRFERGDSPWTVPATYGYDAARFTLQQYNKAISYLRVGTATNKHALRVALITCMLFVTLEYLRGQYSMGSAHLRHGIQLLTNISVPQPRSSMSPNILSPAEDFAHNALIDSYARLAIQSAMFGHVPSRMCLVMRAPAGNAFPPEFHSMQHARQTLDNLMNRAHCLKRHLHDLKPEGRLTDESEFFDTRHKILTELSCWHQAFRATLAHIKTETTSPRDIHGCILLGTYYEMVVIIASVCLPSAKETIFDSHTENFIAMIGGFEDLCTSSSRTHIYAKELEPLLRGAEFGGQGFTVEAGFIPPVYCTGLKCRVPRVRRQAIRILRSVPHREGVWNGPLLADVLEQVIRIEEGGLYAGDSSIEEPIVAGVLTEKDLSRPRVDGFSRIMDVSVHLPDEVNGDTIVSYKKQIGEGHWASFTERVCPSVLRGPLDLRAT
ncbi:uncharacterized protein N7482_001300 [Penicillium canariense]|uniref:Zn(2)-C6 fungal-type domain-containing protein n=1 Tax=Penicillium canariense TaxID=189055 RepID=A0A9W9IEV0_9EURO|nr:uncharacterized protein N7482_001300 [Penicillium canariense]KAJ5175423.1 hypothetical protein N7482_001300 [Penicillium canariense]